MNGISHEQLALCGNRVYNVLKPHRKERNSPLKTCMSDIEKLQKAKMYMEKLADGINPLDGSVVEENDIVNNIHISRCFFYVADVLRQLIEKEENPLKETCEKHPFFLTEEQIEQYRISDKPVTISEITKQFNELINPELYKKLTHNQITTWLIYIGALRIEKTADGSSTKIPTSQGKALGITTEKRMGMNGEYTVTVYNAYAQRLILEHLEIIVSGVFSSQNPEDRTDNRGQPWTKEQEEYLTTRYLQKASVSTIAEEMQRSKGAILSRLKKLALL